ncbi:dienelactone hydrolase family protein [Vineibacter terrae]|uniref:Dienelactone hydrolase family protein n=2 Tax=Vineibacter terrae TaxID=2586908 RepID=A0A5C8PCH4_9HYPH|nr:dienelactone hydrolase family protein [Vineibacter terrae]
MGGYLAKPKSGSGPGVLVIQEIFGVNKVMRDICDSWAAQGYVALSPDIFWRQEEGVDITDQSQDEWNQAFALYKGFDQAKGIDDLKVSLAFLRATAGCTGKVGVTGYCLGGFLTYMMMCHSDAEAGAAYYGVGIDGKLDDAKGLQNPTILHIAEKDGFVPPDTQKKIRDGLKDNPHVTVHGYANDDHAFCRVGGQHYNEASCKLANGRTLDLFKKALA